MYKAWWLLGALLSGCAIEIDLPPEFLQLHASDSELKATTPDNALLWVREFKDGDQGSLGFWAEALADDLTRNRGYALVDEREVVDGTGRKGAQQQYAMTLDGEVYGYLATVYVIEGTFANTVRVAEFTAPTETFAENLESVRKALATLRP